MTRRWMEHGVRGRLSAEARQNKFSGINGSDCGLGEALTTALKNALHNRQCRKDIGPTSVECQVRQDFRGLLFR